MVDAVILILREVLEAALIVSLLLALTHKLKLHYRWSLFALAGGFMGSALLAHYAPVVAEALDGRGQELLNAALYLTVIASLLLAGVFVSKSYFTKRLKTGQHHIVDYQNNFTLAILCGLIVSFSLAREGSEIWIYFSSFEIKSQAFYATLTGAVIGLGIGMSLGGIMYYLLIFMRDKYFIPGFLALVTVLAGGLSMQIAKQFMQVGLLDSNGPLWDSSFLINERSWVGELLYALFGYDAQPTTIQVIFYVAATLPILLCVVWHWHSAKDKSRDKSNV
jgi:high-affinity iron transporter